MKKVLLATSALMLVAGAAAAEVKISGKGRMGVVYDGSDALFSSRIRIIFDASGESDSGLSFGASVRNDQSGVGNTANGDSTVWVSGAFGKVTMGDTGNASDSLLGQVSGVGYTGLGDLNEIPFVGKDTTGAEYDYTSGPFAFSLGLGQPAVGVDFVSVAVKYTADTWSVGASHEDSNVADGTVLTGSATFGQATVKAKVADYSNTTETEWALSLDYKANDALTVTGFAAHAFNSGSLLVTDRYGIGASYDLGGGAAMVGGIAREEGKDAVADLGLTFAF